MAVRKRGRINWYDFFFRGERYQRSTRVTNLVAAKRIEEAVRTRLALEAVHAADPEPVQLPLFADYVPQFMAWSKAHHRPGTSQLHRNNLLVLSRYFGKQRLDAITPAAIEEFKLARLQERRRGHGWKRPEAERDCVSHVSANRL